MTGYLKKEEGRRKKIKKGEEEEKGKWFGVAWGRQRGVMWWGVLSDTRRIIQASWIAKAPLT